MTNLSKFLLTTGFVITAILYVMYLTVWEIRHLHRNVCVVISETTGEAESCSNSKK